MEFLGFLLLLIILVIPFIVYVNLVKLLFQSPIKNLNFWRFVQLWAVVINPTIFLFLFDIYEQNDCCSDSAAFSPAHRIGIYTLIVLCIIAYIISMFKKKILPPIVELVLNLFLLLGLVINLILTVHLGTSKGQNVDVHFPFLIFGVLPIIILFLIKLYENHYELIDYIDANQLQVNSLPNKIIVFILELSPLYKYPILLFLLVPILILFSLFLVLFGQQPDSLIRAFTDTYKHGFSELDYMCDNVECGGHFLCSVGANGHKNIVKPIRYGERNGNKIICNRQLLISNAFEELVQQKLPKTHRVIRRNYNKVGDVVHKYYDIFNIKIVSDLVYILMKPLEWFFLLTLYTFDEKPENRIALQYLKKADKIEIQTMKKP